MGPVHLHDHTFRGRFAQGAVAGQGVRLGRLAREVFYMDFPHLAQDSVTVPKGQRQSSALLRKGFSLRSSFHRTSLGENVPPCISSLSSLLFWGINLPFL